MRQETHHCHSEAHCCAPGDHSPESRSGVQGGKVDGESAATRKGEKGTCGVGLLL